MSVALICFDVVMPVSGHHNTTIRTANSHFEVCFMIEIHKKLCQWNLPVRKMLILEQYWYLIGNKIQKFSKMGGPV